MEERKSKAAFNQLTSDEKAIIFSCLKAVASGVFNSRQEITSVIDARPHVIDLLVDAYPDIEPIFRLIAKSSDSDDEVERAIRGCLVYCTYVIPVDHKHRDEYFIVDKAAIERLLYRWSELSGFGYLNQDRPLYFIKRKSKGE